MNLLLLDWVMYEQCAALRIYVLYWVLSGWPTWAAILPPLSNPHFLLTKKKTLPSGGNMNPTVHYVEYGTPNGQIHKTDKEGEESWIQTGCSVPAPLVRLIDAGLPGNWVDQWADGTSTASSSFFRAQKCEKWKVRPLFELYMSTINGHFFNNILKNLLICGKKVIWREVILQ